MSKENKNKEKQRNSAGYESRTGKVRETKAIATPAGVSVLSLMPKVGQGSRAHSLSECAVCPSPSVIPACRARTQGFDSRKIEDTK